VGRILTACLLTLALAVSLACGSGDEGGGGNTADPERSTTTSTTVLGPETDICGWLPTTALAEAGGKPVSEAVAADDGEGAPRCTYLLGDDRVASIDLLVYPDDGPARFEAGRTVDKSWPIPEVGDDAYWRPDFHDLSVLFGDRAFTIELNLFPPLPDEHERAKRLAPTVITRLEELDG
jgi:hypothetical protein